MTDVPDEAGTRLDALSRMFGEEVTGLSVPGMKDGFQTIAITFASGEGLTVEARSIESAWSSISDAALRRGIALARTKSEPGE